MQPSSDSGGLWAIIAADKGDHLVAKRVLRDPIEVTGSAQVLAAGGLLAEIEDLPLATHAAERSKDIDVHPRKKKPPVDA